MVGKSKIHEVIKKKKSFSPGKMDSNLQGGYLTRILWSYGRRILCDVELGATKEPRG